MLASCDVGLVTLLPGLGAVSVPSKMIAYMAAGRPIIAAVDEDCDTADQVRGPGAGLVCPPGDPEALAAAVVRLQSEPALRRRMGEAARVSFAQRFAKSVVLPRFCALLENLVSR